jgi:hypothetical protein
VLYALGDPVSFVVLVVGFLLAATLHGWVQAIVAARTGDRRPAAEGRTRLDPRRHVDPSVRSPPGSPVSVGRVRSSHPTVVVAARSSRCC